MIFVIISIIILISGYFILGGCFFTYNIGKNKVFLKKSLYTEHVMLKKKVALIIPVYKEEKIISQTIEYYDSLLNLVDGVEVYIVATARENNSGFPTTYDIAIDKKDTVHNRNYIHVLQADLELEGKVGQLNYAFNYLREKGYTYLGVYDVDSRPELNVFMEINQELEKNIDLPDVFQQVSNYCNDLGDISGLTKIMAFSDAITQTKWALGFEYCIFSIYNWCVNKKLIRPLVYCIGHGCFVKCDFLKNVGGFPTHNKNDDLSLGYMCSVLGARIKPLRALDNCQIALGTSMTIKQYAFWYAGSARFADDIRYYSKIFDVNLGLFQRKIFAIEGNLRNFLWAFRGDLLIIITLLSLLVHRNTIYILVIMSWILYVIIPQMLLALYLIKYRDIKCKKITLLFLMVTFCINIVIRGIGPSLGALSLTIMNRGEYHAKRL